MRSGNLTLVVCAAILLAPAVPAQGSEAPAGCEWQAIPELKANLALPVGWEFERLSDEDPLIYEVRPAGEAFEVPPRARYRLIVERNGDPAAVVGAARDYVEQVRTTGVAPADVEEGSIGVIRLFASVVFISNTETGEHESTVAVSALANSRTGTLYKTRLEIPVEELEAVAPLANQLFQTLRMDDEI